MVRLARVSASLRLHTEPVRRLTYVVLASLVALAGCNSAPDKVAGTGALVWCGQRMLANDGAAWGRTELGVPTSQPVRVASSVLPPRLGSSESVAAYSNLVIISRNCDHGAVVLVTGASTPVRVVSIAYDSSRHGITALLLGRTTNAPADVQVTAFEGDKDIGQADLRF